MAMRKRKYYALEFLSVNGNLTVLHIRQDHHAEQILRGLVHSGIAVRIEEIDKMVEVEDEENMKYDPHVDMVRGIGMVTNPVVERD